MMEARTNCTLKLQRKISIGKIEHNPLWWQNKIFYLLVCIIVKCFQLHVHDDYNDTDIIHVINTGSIWIWNEIHVKTS